MRYLVLLITVLFLGAVQAEQVQIKHEGLVLNANLEKAEGSGPVVLMTHGTLAHNRMEIMETLQALFLEHGVSSLAISLSLDLSDRNGMYPCATPHTHQHTDALDEIGLWADWLKARGVGEIVLLGHSRGGNQVAWFAAERADPVISKLILVAPQVWEKGKWMSEYQESYNKSLQPLMEKARALVASGKGDTLMQSVDFIYCPETSATAEAFVSYYAADERFDTPSLLKEISKPVLVFIGSEDNVVAGLTESVARFAGRDGLSIETIDGADHFFRDLYAEDLVESAVEFMGQ